MRKANWKLLKQPNIAGVSIVIGLILILATIKYFQVSWAIAAGQSQKPPPTAVTSTKAMKAAWQQTIPAVGSLIPIQGVTLSANTAGAVTKIHFESGTPVKAGDVIVELDSAVEEAKLRAAKAMKEAALQHLTRAQKLITNNAMSKASLEEAEASYRSADAEVASLKAQIDKLRIVAPFEGRLGIRSVNIGEYVSLGVPVIPLHDIRTLYVNFRVPQISASQIALGNKVDLRLSGQEDQRYDGTVTAMDPQVDEATRTVEIQATVLNPGEKLRPGMFVHVLVELGRTDEFIVLPASSVQYAPYGDTVFVIEQMKTPEGATFQGVRSQVIKLGQSRGEQVAILEGIHEGEEIVSSGTFKLRQGAEVVVNNSFSPGNSPNPTPPDA